MILRSYSWSKVETFWEPDFHFDVFYSVCFNSNEFRCVCWSNPPFSSNGICSKSWSNRVKICHKSINWRADI